jgi:hypothetical protein
MSDRSFDTDKNQARADHMKPIKYLPLACLFLGLNLEAQITITSDDMYNQPGEYYRSYVNQPPALLQRFPVTVAGKLGEPGGPNFWDFTDGPTDEVFRYDYVAKATSIVFNDFPEASLAERSYRESKPNDVSWIMFDDAENLGRKVFGFWIINAQFDDPSNRFTLPIVDFPAEINYGDTWTTTVEYQNSLLGIPAIYNEVQSFEADAYGFIELPELGVFECLRINSLKDFSVAIDFNGTATFTNVERQFTRIYYWLVPGKGIAAQIVSEPSGNPVAEQFNLASMFQRTFETNKEEKNAGCLEAAAVTGLDIVHQPNLVRLKWNEADCAQNYRVQFTTSGLGAEDWTDLSPTPYTDTFFIDTNVNKARFKIYRVLSERN